MSAALQRRYGRLLRLYPADFRRDRGAEVLDTLLDAAEDGRMRPAWRETGAMVLGALRAHAGRDQRRSVRDSWLTALRAAALMLLAAALARTFLRLAVDLSVGGPMLWWVAEPEALNLVSLALTVLALIAALSRRHLVGAVLAAVAFGLAAAVTRPGDGPVFGAFEELPLAVLLLLAVAGRRPAPASGLLRYAPVIPAVLVLAEFGLASTFPEVSGIVTRALALAAVLAALLWLAVDERVTTAFGLLLLNSLLVQAAWLVVAEAADPRALALALTVGAAGPVLLLGAAGAATRRQARL
jgi:hypothetical protein